MILLDLSLNNIKFVENLNKIQVQDYFIATQAERYMPKAKKTKHQATESAGLSKIYELEVGLVSGLITKKFADQNPHVMRTIEIRGRPNADLHEAILPISTKPFSTHTIGSMSTCTNSKSAAKARWIRRARRYVLPMMMEEDWSASEACRHGRRNTHRLAWAEGEKCLWLLVRLRR